MNRPLARAVSKKINFSSLYSLIALIKSSCAIPPSIQQYSGYELVHKTKGDKKIKIECVTYRMTMLIRPAHEGEISGRPDNK